MNEIVMGLTLLVLSAAACTDIRRRRIPNLLTYAGIAVAICFAVTADWQAIVEPNPFQAGTTLARPFLPEMEPNQITCENESVPAEPLATYRSFAGALGCFAILLLAYLCGGLGGGDVKLGAFLGAATGFEVGVSILCIGHLLAGTFGFLFFLGRSCRKDQSTMPGKGIPMALFYFCLLYTSPSPRDRQKSRMPSSA